MTTSEPDFGGRIGRTVSLYQTFKIHSRQDKRDVETLARTELAKE